MSINKYDQVLTWLRRIDELLASDGVHVATLASELDTSTKTIHRVMDAMKKHDLRIESIRIDERGKYYYVYRYVDRRSRMFAKKLC